MPPPNTPLALTREYLLDDAAREQLRGLDPEMKVMPAEMREASIAGLLARRTERNGVWIFAYGSLIWNPLFEVCRAARRQGARLSSAFLPMDAAWARHA